MGEIPQLILSKLNLVDFLYFSINYVSTDRTHIELSCPKEIEGTWSKDALIRIMEILLSNAIKYRQVDGVIKMKAGKIQDDIVAITVHNDGYAVLLKDPENILNYLKCGQMPSKTPVPGNRLNNSESFDSCIRG